VRQPLKEGGAIEALQAALPSKLGEDALRIARDVFGAGVERIGLRAASPCGRRICSSGWWKTWP
jgi:hypothetical protein